MKRTDGELILVWTVPVLGLLWITAFFLFPGFVHPMAPTMSADEVAAFYRDPQNLPRIRYSMILFNWFCVGLIPLLMMIAIHMRRMAHRTPIFSYCIIACAAGGPTVFLFANLLWAIAAFRPDRAPEATMAYNDLAWVTFTAGVPFLIAQSAILAAAIYLDRQPQPVFRRWVAHFNLLVAAALIPAAFTGLAMEGPLAWNGLLSFWVKNIAIAVWIVVMGIVMARLIAGRRAAGNGADAAAGNEGGTPVASDATPEAGVSA